ncbi:MAG: hypothetical protein ACK55I_33675, partial [bacterium]
PVRPLERHAQVQRHGVDRQHLRQDAAVRSGRQRYLPVRLHPVLAVWPYFPRRRELPLPLSREVSAVQGTGLRARSFLVRACCGLCLWRDASRLCRRFVQRLVVVVRPRSARRAEIGDACRQVDAMRCSDP